jgi:hypothetical protein
MIRGQWAICRLRAPVPYEHLFGTGEHLWHLQPQRPDRLARGRWVERRDLPTKDRWGGCRRTLMQSAPGPMHR